jgi:hypothetical protein
MIEVLMCVRVADMAATPVPSRIDRCQTCGSQVWVSRRAPPISRLMCQQCAMDVADEDDEFDVADETRAEVEEHLARKR